jgi:hypothetical protein
LGDERSAETRQLAAGSAPTAQREGVAERAVGHLSIAERRPNPRSITTDR